MGIYSKEIFSPLQLKFTNQNLFIQFDQSFSLPCFSVKGVDDMDSKFGYVPTFTKRLSDVKCSEGAHARFDCKVMGIPEPEISWYVRKKSRFKSVCAKLTYIRLCSLKCQHISYPSHTFDCMNQIYIILLDSNYKFWTKILKENAVENGSLKCILKET